MVTCSPGPPRSSRACSALSPSLASRLLQGRWQIWEGGDATRWPGPQGDSRLRHSPLKPLCSRGNPSQDHRALAACHTRPRPQLPHTSAHRRAYPRLSTSGRVASREQTRRSKPHPGPQIPMGRGIGRSLKASAAGRSPSRKDQRVKAR